MKKNILLVFAASLLYTTSAYAYLDGGTAGMVIQLLLGGVAVAGTFIKIYWHKIKSFILKFCGKTKTTESLDCQKPELNAEDK